MSLIDLRTAIRENTLADERDVVGTLLTQAEIGADRRKRAQTAAATFVKEARANANRSGLIDKFLQEYGLSTKEGVTLMRLAEALLRTPDATTADALIRDKVETGDWAAHKGKSPFPLVNFSTRALMLTAAWLDDVEAKDPARKIVSATKDILDRVGEPVIRASVAHAMKIMGEHFVLGQTIDDAQKRGNDYMKRGYSFSYDMLGEAAHTAKDAEKYFQDYHRAITAIAKHATADSPKENPGISVKLSALHPRYEYAKRTRVLRELGERIAILARQAKAANIGFNIDAEEADRLDLSLDLIEQLMRDQTLDNWDGFGVVVQSYQRRAIHVLDWLAALTRQTNRRIMVRLVKGAYWDSEIKRAQVMGLESYPVFTRKVSTDLSYAACARKLLENTDVFYPQFATHNALTAAMVREVAGDYKDYELQRLHGMGEALHDNLIAQGARSRIYAPVGGHKELLPYLVRRLLENGANSSFVNQLLDPDLSIDDVIADPVDEMAQLHEIANPAICAPRDLFNAHRLSARGWDETDPVTAAHLESVVKSGPVPPQDITERLLRENETWSGVRNPTHGWLSGVIKTSSAAEIDTACAAAHAAQAAWAARDDRRQILKNAADFLEEAAENFMRIATQEAGKTIPDAIAEVREAVDFLRYYANAIATLSGAPVGVIACISPWNFPLAIFLGQISAALAAGNAVVAKPAEQTPGIAAEAIRLLYKAGVPEDVLHAVYGDGPSVGGPLVAHPAIDGVVFTGSTKTAQIINRGLIAAKKYDAPLIAETGGINAMIVDSTALLEQAVTDIIASAFQSAGQRCSACRLVFVQEDIADRFNEMLSGAMAELTVGDPAMLETDIGPVIDGDAKKTIDEHIARMRQTASVIAQAPAIAENINGTFVRPIAFEIPSIRSLSQEIFGPVLHVVRFKARDITDSVDQINDLGFGLTMGVHTRVDETMHAIVGAARIGNVYVNRNQIGAVVGVQPFGGEGLSGTGPKAGGPHYLNALRKFHYTEGSATIHISDDQQNLLNETIDLLNRDYKSWMPVADKAAIFDQAATQSSNDVGAILRDAATLRRQLFDRIDELPGPTGESNTLKLKGRGIVIALGGGDDLSNKRQITLALAAGNSVICNKYLGDQLAKALAPLHVGSIVAGADFAGKVSRHALLNSHISAIVFDGTLQSKHALADALSTREGAIIPLLSATDAPHRFAVERTLTINTTAAGGDVRLLSLSQ